MYQIGPKIRFVFRSLAFFLLAAVLLLGASAIALPYLVESGAVRESLVRNMTSWTGGNVKINGRIRVASFIALTIEARDVTFTGTKRLDPVDRMEVRSLKGIASFTGLLRGRIEFRKVIFSSPTIVLRRNLRPQIETASTGLKALATPIVLAMGSPFADLTFKDSTVVLTDGEGRPPQTFAIPRMELAKAEAKLAKSGQFFFGVPSQASPDALTSSVAMSIRLNGMQASFRGEIDASSQVANGNLTVAVSSTEPVAPSINRAVFPWEEICDISLSARLTWSADRIAVDKARFRFGDRRANGSFGLALAGGRLTLEATLAYDTIDISPLLAAVTADGDSVVRPNPLAVIFPREGTLPVPDLDLRLSAEQVRLPNNISGGPLAVAVTSQRGRFSADLAELGLFGGSLRGRLDYDPAETQTAIVKATGEHINTPALFGALALPGIVNGNANFALSLAIPQAWKQSGSLWGAGTEGRFTISLPGGGALDANVSRQLSKALGDLANGWTSDGGDALPVSELTIDGNVEQRAIAVTARGEMEKGQFSASLKINPSDGALNGSLALSGASFNSDTATQGDATQISPFATVTIGGTASLPEFSAATPRHFSN